MNHLVLLFCLVVAQVPDASPPESDHFKLGTVLVTNQPGVFGVTPSLNDQADFQTFVLEELKEPGSGAKKMSRVITSSRNGRAIKVMAYHSAESLKLPISAFIGEILEGSQVGVQRWFACQHFLPIEFVQRRQPRLPHYHWNRAVALPINVGDVARLCDEDLSPVLVCEDMFAYEALVKALLAKDTVGVQELKAANRVSLVDAWTSVLVVKLHENQFIGEGVPAAEVRLKSGPNKDRLVWTFKRSVVYMTWGFTKPEPLPPTEAELDARRLKDFQETSRRAETRLRSAKALEKAGKTKGALETYRSVLKDFGETDAAKEAEKRVKALSTPVKK